MAGELENFGDKRHNGKGSRTGSRQKMTKEMLCQMEQLMATGKSPTEILWEFTQREDVPMDLKLKSVFKIVDLIYPKAASVEVKIEEEKPKDTGTIDRLIQEKLAALGMDTEADEAESDTEEEEAE